MDIKQIRECEKQLRLTIDTANASFLESVVPFKTRDQVKYNDIIYTISSISVHYHNNDIRSSMPVAVCFKLWHYNPRTAKGMSGKCSDVVIWNLYEPYPFDLVVNNG